jgi:probable HAF family extracellular repeat protein
MLTELKPLGASGGSNMSLAYGINYVGQVAGDGTSTQNDGYHATTWNGAAPTDLGPLPGGMSGSGYFAFAINTIGQTVGLTNGFPGGPQATIWNGTFPSALPTPSGLISSQAAAINTAGQAVGQAGNTDTHAIIWNGGVPTDLNALSGNAGAALAINNLGQVVGNSYPSGVSGLAHATIWNGTTPTDLGTLGGLYSDAYGINDSGVVVGQSSVNAQGTGPQAFIWNGGTMNALSLLPNAGASTAYGINNTGVIVGTTNMNVGERHATIWNAGISTDLNTLLDSSGAGWLLIDALAINGVGQIVGDGFNGSGQVHAYLLTPKTPSPNGTTISAPTSQFVTDAGGHIFTFAQQSNPTYGYTILKDGAPPPYGGLAVTLIISNGAVWAYNAQGQWWTNTGTNWVFESAGPP